MGQVVDGAGVFRPRAGYWAAGNRASKIMQVSVAWAMRRPLPSTSLASEVAMRAPAWITLPSQRTRPVSGIVCGGFAAAIFTPWLYTKPDFTVSYHKGQPLGHRVLRNRAGGALLFPDRLSAARGLRAMRAAMLPLEGVEWRGGR